MIRASTILALLFVAALSAVAAAHIRAAASSLLALPLALRVACILLLGACVIIGSTKNNQPLAGQGAMRKASIRNAAEIRPSATEFDVGYALVSCSMDSSISNALYCMPSNAVENWRWERRGAFDDEFAESFSNRVFTSGSNDVRSVFVSAFGHLAPFAGGSRANVPVFMPLNRRVSLPPIGATGGENAFHGKFWMAETGNRTMLFTWQDALADREDAGSAVTFQVELSLRGTVRFRYDARCFAGMRARPAIRNNGAEYVFGGDESSISTNAYARLLAAMAIGSFVELELAPIEAGADLSADSDQDGLTDFDEIFVHRTDPKDADTDGDGASDSAELLANTDPLDPDTDDDGVPDGWTGDAYAASGIFDPAGGKLALTVEQIEPLPSGERAALSVGGVPLVLSDSVASSWTIYLATNELAHVVLSAVGDAQPRLRISGDSGLYVDDVGGVFSEAVAAISATDPAARSSDEPRKSGKAEADIGSVHGVITPEDPVLMFIGDTQSFSVSFTGLGDVEWTCEYGDICEYMHGIATYRFTGGMCGYATVTASLSSGAIVSGNATASVRVPVCDRRVGLMWDLAASTGNFSPALGESAGFTLNIEECEHEEYEVKILKIEVGRDTRSGWQHLAWLDANPATPAFDESYVLPDEYQPATYTWDGSAERAAAQAEDFAEFTRGARPFNRVFPAVSAGSPVPPPFCDVRALIYDAAGGDPVICETYRVYIPQVVNITWDNETITKLETPFQSKKIPGNFMLYGGLSNSQSYNLLCAVSSGAKSVFPDSCNIRFVANRTIAAGDYKTILLSPQNLNSFMDGCDLGIAMTPQEIPNVSASGYAEVFIGSILNSADKFYYSLWASGKSFSNSPLTPTKLYNYLVRVVCHETGHLLGMVSDTYLFGDGKHNTYDGNTNFIMNRGRFIPVNTAIDDLNKATWKTVNMEYLEFLLEGD